MNTASSTNSDIPSIIDMGSIRIPDVGPRLERLADLLDQVNHFTPSDSSAHPGLLEARALLQDIQAEALIQVTEPEDDSAAVAQPPADSPDVGLHMSHLLALLYGAYQLLESLTPNPRNVASATWLLGDALVEAKFIDAMLFPSATAVHHRL